MTAPRSRARSVGFVLVLLLLALHPLDSRLRHRRGRRARHRDHELEADDGDDPAAGFGASPFTTTDAGGSRENAPPIIDLAQVVARLPRGDESRAGGGGGGESGAWDGRGVGAGAEADGGADGGAGVRDSRGGGETPGMVAGATISEALPRFSRTQTETQKTKTQTPTTTQPARDSATETTDGVTDATADTERGISDSQPIDLAQAVAHPQHQLPPPSSRFVSSLGTVYSILLIRCSYSTRVPWWSGTSVPRDSLPNPLPRSEAMMCPTRAKSTTLDFVLTQPSAGTASICSHFTAVLPSFFPSLASLPPHLPHARRRSAHSHAKSAGGCCREIGTRVY